MQRYCLYYKTQQTLSICATNDDVHDMHFSMASVEVISL